MNKKLSLVLISTFLLCSCAERTYEAFGSLSSEQVETILCSYFEKYEIKKSEYVNYKIYAHLVTLNDNISADVIRYRSSSSNSECVIENFYLNDTYICYVPDSSCYLNFCTLNEKTSYSLKEAYDNNVINDDDVQILIQAADEQGFRKK